MIQRVLESLEHVQFAVIHSIECLSPRFLYESVLSQLGSEERCDNANDFAKHLARVCVGPTCIVLDKAERMRDLNDGMLIPMLTKIPEFTGLNISIILVSEIPYEKFRSGTGGLEPIHIFFPQYTKGKLSLNCFLTFFSLILFSFI